MPIPMHQDHSLLPAEAENSKPLMKIDLDLLLPTEDAPTVEQEIPEKNANDRSVKLDPWAQFRSRRRLLVSQKRIISPSRLGIDLR